VSDLEIIDRLLHMMVDHQKGGWAELEQRYNITEDAMRRLRLAYQSGEMRVIGLGLAQYFKSTPIKLEGGAIVTNPKWEVGPVKLVGGHEAIIDAINEDQEDWRYSGRVRSQRGIMVSTGWHANGRYMYAETGHGYNLAPPPKKTMRFQRWMVVYYDGSSLPFVNKEDAKEEAEKSGFALLEIDREVTEREGL
jgi:hypothetical protein